MNCIEKRKDKHEAKIVLPKIAKNQSIIIVVVSCCKNRYVYWEEHPTRLVGRLAIRQ
jgi:hypothetical protein